MRILNLDNEEKVDNIVIYLLNSEAKELYDSLESLLKSSNIKNNHTHVSSSDFKKEITLCIYNPNDLEGFNKRSKKLITDDK